MLRGTVVGRVGDGFPDDAEQVLRDLARSNAAPALRTASPDTLTSASGTGTRPASKCLSVPQDASRPHRTPIDHANGTVPGGGERGRDREGHERQQSGQLVGPDEDRVCRVRMPAGGSGGLRGNQLGRRPERRLVRRGAVRDDLEPDHHRGGLTGGGQPALSGGKRRRGRHHRQPEPVPGDHLGGEPADHHHLRVRLHDERPRHDTDRLHRHHPERRHLELRHGDQRQLTHAAERRHGGRERGRRTTPWW